MCREMGTFMTLSTHNADADANLTFYSIILPPPGHACGLPHTDGDYFNEDSKEGDCLDYTIKPENNKKPGTFNFQLLEQLYGTLDPNNRNLQDTDPAEDDTPEDVKELIDDFVSAMENSSCQEYDAISGLQVTQLEANDDGENACELELPGGYSVQIRKLLETNWDLID